MASNDPISLFACPFYANDPVRHQACDQLMLRSATRVKKHLRRKHYQPVHCGRCFQTFDNDAALANHMNVDTLCNFARPVDWGANAITKEQQVELSRRGSRRSEFKRTESEKWYDIYKILFPFAERPHSPYVGQSESRWQSEVVAFAETEGHRILDKIIPTMSLGPILRHDGNGHLLHSVCRVFGIHLLYSWESRNINALMRRDVLPSTASTDVRVRQHDQANEEQEGVEEDVEGDVEIDAEDVQERMQDRMGKGFVNASGWKSINRPS